MREMYRHFLALVPDQEAIADQVEFIRGLAVAGAAFADDLAGPVCEPGAAQGWAQVVAIAESIESLAAAVAPAAADDDAPPPRLKRSDVLLLHRAADLAGGLRVVMAATVAGSGALVPERRRAVDSIAVVAQLLAEIAALAAEAADDAIANAT